MQLKPQPPSTLTMKKPNIKKRVEAILKEHRRARGNDAILYAFYLQDHHPDLFASGSISELLKGVYDKSVVCMTSISRARRNVEEEYNDFGDASLTKSKKRNSDKWKSELGYN